MVAQGLPVGSDGGKDAQGVFLYHRRGCKGCGLRRSGAACLEGVAEAYIKVDGIHGEGDGLEVFLEDVVQTPVEIGVDVEVAEGTPGDAGLHAPLECAQVFGEVIGGDALAFEHDFVARGVAFAQVTVEDVAGKVAAGHEREVGSGGDTQAVVGLPGGKDGHGEEGGAVLGLDLSGPASGHAFAAVADDFHAVVFGACFGFHAFCLEAESEDDAPFFLSSQPFGDVSSDGDVDVGRVAGEGAYLFGEGKGGGSADVESGADFVFEAVEGRLYDAAVAVFLGLQGVEGGGCEEQEQEYDVFCLHIKAFRGWVIRR